MQSSGKRISAYAVFKAKQNATPKKEARGKVQKPEASTPIVGLIKQGQGKLKKLRESARSKKSKRASKRSEITTTGSRRLQSDNMDVDVEGESSKALPSQGKPSRREDTSDTKPSGSGQKKRKSPYTTTPDEVRRKKAREPLHSVEPSRKRLKFQESEAESTLAGPSSCVRDDSLKRDSLQHGKDVFSWLIAPFKVEDYFKNIFERKPLFLKRHKLDYFSDIFSSKELHDILKENDLQFTRNIDVTTYTDGKRETHNPTGRAHPQVIWDYYKNGCSVRVLNPQTYSTRVWQLLAALQEFFGCFVGANIYLTPPGSQGFAPHYDDIEAFVLQLEGKKHWKLYNQRSTAEVLPRFSSCK